MSSFNIGWEYFPFKFLDDRLLNGEYAIIDGMSDNYFAFGSAEPIFNNFAKIISDVAVTVECHSDEPIVKDNFLSMFTTISNMVANSDSKYGFLTALYYLSSTQIPGGLNKNKSFINSEGIITSIQHEYSDLDWKEFRNVKVGPIDKIISNISVPNGFTLSALSDDLSKYVYVEYTHESTSKFEVEKLNSNIQMSYLLPFSDLFKGAFNSQINNYKNLGLDFDISNMFD